jgi:integrase/recombinase XerC
VFYTAQFLQHLTQERRLSVHTTSAYEADLQLFVAYCQDIQCLTSVTEVGHLHVRGWLAHMLEGGLSTRSANRRLSCLKTYFLFLKKQGIVTHDPLKKVVAPRTGKRLPVILQERELEALFTEVVFPDGPEGALHRVVLELLYATGMRRSELTALKINDLDFERSVIKILGKGGKERLVPLARYLAPVLQDWLAARRAVVGASIENALLLTPKGQPLQPQAVYRIVKHYLSYVTSAEQRSPHVLRHSFATHLSNRGADLNAIKDLLGHASLAATQVYMHNSISKLQEIYDRAHPKAESPDEVPLPPTDPED